MSKKELLAKLEKWEASAHTTKKGDKTILSFNDKEVFQLFGKEEVRVLNPSNTYTYQWLYSFFDDLIEYLENNKTIEEAFDEFEDDLPKLAGKEVSVYPSDLTEWLNDNINNIDYITIAQCKNPQIDGFGVLQQAQYQAIEELYKNALRIIKEVGKNEFR